MTCVDCAEAGVIGYIIFREAPNYSNVCFPVCIECMNNYEAEKHVLFSPFDDEEDV